MLLPQSYFTDEVVPQLIHNEIGTATWTKHGDCLSPYLNLFKVTDFSQVTD